MNDSDYDMRALIQLDLKLHYIFTIIGIDIGMY